MRFLLLIVGWWGPAFAGGWLKGIEGFAVGMVLGWVVVVVLIFWFWGIWRGEPHQASTVRPPS
jgi:hypothetical protein